MKIIAHRGDSASHPENTPRSWAAAYANGAYAIEADIRMSKDGSCICAHDPDLARLFGRPERPENLTRDVLLALESETGARIATLEEVLCHAAEGRAVLLDIKDESLPALVAIGNAIVATVPPAARRRIVAGCHTLEAVTFFSGGGEVEILGFIPDGEKGEAFNAAGAGIIRLWERDVTAARVSRLQALGAEVWATAGGVGTIHDTGDTAADNLSAMAAAGIDGVLVNDVAMTKIILETLR
ncbi:glycerophosphodiester phosphodiesterase [Martelella endophytica]|uniref:glycerophosphodiester phosphodiesterase n=1 Tax=Martelella endophytica TaxID=1486262 RepID=UPI000695DE37|nr:glycerophosphodiester phosphodiesterase family protein [Martelella endophytica]